MFTISRFAATQTELSSFVDESKVAWFHAGHLGEILEFTTASRYLPAVLLDAEYREVKFKDAGRPALFVREEAVYILIMRSKSAFADKFQRWLAYEVLPSIRKTGSYTATAADQKHFTPFGLTLKTKIEECDRYLEAAQPDDNISKVLANKKALEAAYKAEKGSELKGDGKKAQLEKILNLGRQLGGLTPRILTKKRLVQSAQEAKEIFQKLVDAGHGKIVVTKPGIKPLVTWFAN
jgi:prophage antirepressor-like protein